MADKKIEADMSSILVISPSFDEEDFSSNGSNHLSLEAENQILKRQCDALKARLDSLSKSSPPLVPQNSITNLRNENGDCKDDFVDVNCLVIFEKIEEHLKEANRIFSDNLKYKEAFVYLVNNFWSLTAYMYSDFNLQQAKLLRDELLKKIEQTDLIQSTIMTTSTDNNQTITEKSSFISPLSSSITRNDSELFSSMNLDIDLLQNCKATTDSLQARLIEQNNMLKSFLKDMEEKSFEDEKLAKIERLKLKLGNDTNTKLNSFESNQKNKKEIETQISDNNKIDEENFSPGSSPSSFFMNKFDRLLTNTQKNNDISAIENHEENATITESEAKPEISSTSTENTSQTIDFTVPKSTDQSIENDKISEKNNSSSNPKPQSLETHTESHDDSLYLYCVNDGDYIGVNNTLELDPNGETAAQTANNQNSDQPYPKIHQSNVENYVQYEDLSNNLGYKCPQCKNVADSSLISYEAYLKHLIECDPNNNRVCNICMQIFDKNVTSVEIERHINNHFSE